MCKLSIRPGKTYHRGWLAIALALVLLLAAGPVAAAPTVLDFEDLAAPATITSQYGARGVLFQQAYLGTDPAAHSGTRVLRTVAPTAEVFTPIPLVMNFTSPQARVKLFAGSPFAPLTGTLTGFDAGGNVVIQDGPKLVAADVFTTMFEISVSSATMMRAELQLEGSAHQAIDDLEFEGEPALPPPPTPPVVHLTQPLDGVDLDIPDDLPKLDIAGTVEGEGLLSPVTVTVAYKQPPESTAGPLTLDLDLIGSGTLRQFSLPGGMPTVPLGPITVTASAQNIGALVGTDTSSFTNLPIAVRNRFITEGGATVLGDFQYGLSVGNCKFAVYKHGAISGRSGGATLVSGDILSKWLSLRTLANSDSLGCPMGEERDALGGARAQDFDHGRIYARLPDPAKSASTYVPGVFRDALAKRGDEAGVGVPLGDPSDSTGAMRTWLFQQFFRPDRSAEQVVLLPSTLEIRGTPPAMWMERQGGDWLVGALEPSVRDKDTKKSAATLWESFACNANLGPCTVPDEPPSPPPTTPNAGELFCNGATYIPLLEGECFDIGPKCIGGPCCIPREWEAVRGDYVATPVYGAIVSAHMTDIDNGFTHETHNGNCPYFPNILEVISTVTCISDYEWEVRPVGPQVDTSPLPSLFGKGNSTSIRTEYEVAYASAAHNFLGAPAIGDLVHTTGRWIIDCGHNTYKAELHPIFSYARMKTVVSETNLFTGLEEDLFGNKPATRVAIWINGWYPGGDNNAIEFDAFPPPRPSPDSVLHLVKPVDFAAGGYLAAKDVSLEFNMAPTGAASHVHLRFTSPKRQNAVTAAGEMKFESGRQYWGIWYLYWST